jgi:hypothetical protein
MFLNKILTLEEEIAAEHEQLEKTIEGKFSIAVGRTNYKNLEQLLKNHSKKILNDLTQSKDSLSNYAVKDLLSNFGRITHKSNGLTPNLFKTLQTLIAFKVLKREEILDRARGHVIDFLSDMNGEMITSKILLRRAELKLKWLKALALKYIPLNQTLIKKIDAGINLINNPSDSDGDYANSFGDS